MCLSALGQIIYGSVMLVALGLTITSIATPGWNQFKNGTVNDAKDFNLNSSGLFNFACNITNSTKSSDNNCEWKDIATWGKVVIIAICLAVLLQIAALIWNFVTFCACCCKKYIIHPLTGLAVAISICLAVAIILFGAKHESQLDLKSNNKFSDVKGRGEIGYSFYMACGALAAAIIDIFVGALTVCLAKHCL